MSFREAYDLTQSRSQVIMRYKNRKGERLEVYLTGETLLTIFNLDKKTISTYNRSIDPAGFDKTLTAFLLANSMIK
jgi:hypothetical protein